MMHDLEAAERRQRCWWPPPLNGKAVAAAAEASFSLPITRLLQRASCDPAGSDRWLCRRLLPLPEESTPWVWPSCMPSPAVTKFALPVALQVAVAAAATALVVATAVVPVTAMAGTCRAVHGRLWKLAHSCTQQQLRLAAIGRHDGRQPAAPCTEQTACWLIHAVTVVVAAATAAVVAAGAAAAVAGA